MRCSGFPHHKHSTASHHNGPSVLHCPPSLLCVCVCVCLYAQEVNLPDTWEPPTVPVPPPGLSHRIPYHRGFRGPVHPTTSISYNLLKSPEVSSNLFGTADCLPHIHIYKHIHASVCINANDPQGVIRRFTACYARLPFPCLAYARLPNLSLSNSALGKVRRHPGRLKRQCLTSQRPK